MSHWGTLNIVIEHKEDLKIPEFVWYSDKLSDHFKANSFTTVLSFRLRSVESTDVNYFVEFMQEIFDKNKISKMFGMFVPEMPVPFSVFRVKSGRVFME